MDQQKYNYQPDIGDKEKSAIPSLQNQENNASKNLKGGLYNDSGKSPLGRNTLANKESVSSVSKNLRGAVLNTTPKGKVANKVLGLIQGHKKASAGGLLMLTAALFFIGGSGFLINYAIVTIEKDLIGYEARAERYFENKASKEVVRSLLKKELCKSTSVGKISLSYCSLDQGGEMSDAMDSFDFTNPEVVNLLNKYGIEVNVDEAGQFKGLTNTATGKEITPNDIGNNVDGVGDTLVNAVQEWQVGQTRDFVSQAEAVDGANFDIASDQPNDNVDKAVEDAISTPEDNVNPSITEDKSQSSSSQTPAQAQNAKDVNGADSAMRSAINAADKASLNGANEETTLTDAIRSFKENTAGIFSIYGVISILCNSDKLLNNSVKDRIPQMMGLLIRHATTLISFADQTKTGHITGSEEGQFMSLLSGNSSQPSTVNDGKLGTVPNQAAMSFSQSAAWQRITGNPVNTNKNSPGYTPGISPSALPTQNGAQQILGGLNNFINSLQLGTVCSAINTINNSIFGSIVGIGGLVLQVGGDIAAAVDSGGVGGGAAVAGQAALTGGVIAAIQNVALPDVLKALLPIGVNGLENSVQWMNNADAGENLAINDYARSLGGQPENLQTANSQYAMASKAYINAQANTSIGNRIYALNNPNSLVSKLAIEIPLTKMATLATLDNYFSNFPKNLILSIGSLFTLKSAFAAIPTENPGAAYGFTQYGFNNVTKFDPLENEQYLDSTISFGGKSATRLSLLGDPNKYNDANMGTNPDTSTTDLLHCFLQPYNGGATPPANDNTPQPPCESLGNFDMNQDTPKPITAYDVAWVYCSGLGFPPSDSGNGCMNYMQKEAAQGDDVDRFTQYIMDTHVMSDLTSLTTNN